MCRIAGVVKRHQSVAAGAEAVRTMCDLQRHGGPDDEGFYTDEASAVCFGHRRLSLIDLSPGGHQPMAYQDERLVIVYNGELYNYLELKASLQAQGFEFSSTSDTEVLLAAYAAWGEDAFRRFAGMFGFALFDKAKNIVYLVRDQSGIKPLYYSTHNGSLYFASEVRALAALPELNTAHPHWPVYFLAYGHLPEPITTLQHVKPLSKGCFLRYEVQTGKAQLQGYGHLSYMEKLGNKAEVMATIQQNLRHAVKRHLLSDAPIGAFLSGGIDSSLIALLAGEAIGEQLTTLSIYFNEGEYSEKKYQDLIAAQLRGNHQAFCLTEADFTDNLPRILADMDLPSNDGINTWFISKYAKEAGLKAVLSGLGGDELFGGYPSFERMQKALYLQSLPASVLRAGRHSGAKQLKRLAYLSLPGIKGRYLFLRGQFVPQEIARILNMREGEVWQLLAEQPTMPNIHYLTPRNQASWMEMNLYMQNQLLRDSDVMSMAHGIEIRVPLLDLDLVKLALQIQTPVKYAGGGKQLLVDAFGNLLPTEIYNRRKMGFSFPFREWMANSPWFKQQFSSASGQTQTVYNDFLNGRRHWSQVLSLALISNQHVRTPHSLSYA